MAIDQAQRPQFYEGQYLGAQDLAATVEYSRLLEQRHSLGVHTWGIAIGLTLVETPTPDGSGAVTVTISPGYAWDGFGRPIVVLAPYTVPADLFKSLVYDAAQDANTLPGRSIPIWVQYQEVLARPPANGSGVCGVGNQNSRVQETFQVVAGDRILSEQRDPITVSTWVGDAAGALIPFDPNAPSLPDASIPQQNFPEDNSTAVWLISLGCILWLPNQNASLPGSFVRTSIQGSDSQALKDAKNQFQIKSNALRQYTGVVANAVQAPNGVIHLRDRGTPPASVASRDLVWVEGSLRVDGDVNSFGGKIDFKDNGGTDSKLQIQAKPNTNGGLELELVIGNQNAGKNDLAIGPLDNKDKFTPEVVVLDNGNVGIATTTPTHKLHVSDNSGIRQNRLYLSGGDWSGGGGWCSLTYNAYHDAANANWVFPDTSRSAVTIEMDDNKGSPRFQIFSTTPGATQTWTELFAIDGITGNVAIATSPSSARTTINGALPIQGLLNFFPPGADISYDGGSDKLFLIEALNNAATAFFGGNVGIGTTNPTALLDIANITKFGADGSIKSPLWRVQQLMQSRIGGLPLIQPFNSSGGTLLIFASGSGFSALGSQAIGMQISIDGVSQGRAQSFTNESNSHKAFTTEALVVTGIVAGGHSLSLQALANTSTDFNDFFNVTILELPF
jgi:hypothetical protein